MKILQGSGKWQIGYHTTPPQGFIAVRQVPNISLSTRCIALKDSPAWDAPKFPKSPNSCF
eukprot:2357477-Amphidinium_carterae.1